VSDPEPVRRLVQEALGQAVSNLEQAVWGFQNRTDIVTLASGERIALQRYRRREDAERRLAALHAVAGPAAATGITIPAVIAFDFDHDPPWAIFKVLPGAPATDSGDFAPGGRQFVATTRLMGELLARFRTLQVTDLAIDTLWSDPGRLALQAMEWVKAVTGLDESERAALAAVIAELPALFYGREPVLAHGDYVPMNVLIADGRITGLLDLESVRLADSLFDVAWWAWAVSFSGRDVLDKSLPVFLAAAGIDPDPLLARRLRSLQILRMLELLVEQPDLKAARIIAGRLATTLHEQD
jgi:aminoglycoside phosphotransferase (APT) family kinase protein